MAEHVDGSNLTKRTLQNSPILSHYRVSKKNEGKEAPNALKNERTVFSTPLNVRRGHNNVEVVMYKEGRKTANVLIDKDQKIKNVDLSSPDLSLEKRRGLKDEVEKLDANRMMKRLSFCKRLFSPAKAEAGFEKPVSERHDSGCNSVRVESSDRLTDSGDASGEGRQDGRFEGKKHKTNVATPETETQSHVGVSVENEEILTGKTKKYRERKKLKLLGRSYKRDKTPSIMVEHTVVESVSDGDTSLHIPDCCSYESERSGEMENESPEIKSSKNFFKTKKFRNGTMSKETVSINKENRLFKFKENESSNVKSAVVNCILDGDSSVDKIGDLGEENVPPIGKGKLGSRIDCTAVFDYRVSDALAGRYESVESTKKNFREEKPCVDSEENFENSINIAEEGRTVSENLNSVTTIENTTIETISETSCPFDDFSTEQGSRSFNKLSALSEGYFKTVFSDETNPRSKILIDFTSPVKETINKRLCVNSLEKRFNVISDTFSTTPQAKTTEKIDEVLSQSPVMIGKQKNGSEIVNTTKTDRQTMKSCKRKQRKWKKEGNGLSRENDDGGKFNRINNSPSGSPEIKTTRNKRNGGLITGRKRKVLTPDRSETKRAQDDKSATEVGILWMHSPELKRDIERNTREKGNRKRIKGNNLVTKKTTESQISLEFDFGNGNGIFLETNEGVSQKITTDSSFVNDDTSSQPIDLYINRKVEEECSKVDLTVQDSLDVLDERRSERHSDISGNLFLRSKQCSDDGPLEIIDDFSVSGSPFQRFSPVLDVTQESHRSCNDTAIEDSEEGAVGKGVAKKLFIEGRNEYNYARKKDGKYEMSIIETTQSSESPVVIEVVSSQATSPSKKDTPDEILFSGTSSLDNEPKTPRKPCKESVPDQDLDSGSKRRKKIYPPNSLVTRFRTLRNRYESNLRLWKHEFTQSFSSREPDEDLQTFQITSVWMEFGKTLIGCRPGQRFLKATKLSCKDDPRFWMSSVFHVLTDSKLVSAENVGMNVKIHPPWQVLEIPERHMILVLGASRLEMVVPSQTLCDPERLQSPDCSTIPCDRPIVLETMSELKCDCLEDAEPSRSCQLKLPDRYLTSLICPKPRKYLEPDETGRGHKRSNLYQGGADNPDGLIGHSRVFRFFKPDFFIIGTIIGMVDRKREPGKRIGKARYYIVLKDGNDEICCVMLNTKTEFRRWKDLSGGDVLDASQERRLKVTGFTFTHSVPVETCEILDNVVGVWAESQSDVNFLSAVSDWWECTAVYQTV